MRRVYDHPAWKHVRAAVLERDSYQCQIKRTGCTGQATEVDHIQPLELGGARFDTALLRAACKHCNSAGGADVANAKKRGTPSRDW